MQSIESALKRYNANTSDIRTGDCVCRSISLALNIPYDQVRVDLNHLRKSLRQENYKYPVVYEKYIESHGGVRSNYLLSDNPPGLTVGQFCETYPVGTYLLGVASPHKRREYIDHLVCVIDGDAYDSWDSLKCKVLSVFTVSEDESDMSQYTVDVRRVWEDIADDIESYVVYLSGRDDGLLQISIRRVSKVDSYTVYIDVHVYVQPEAFPEQLERHYRILYSDGLNHRFTLKITPKGTTAEDVVRIRKSIKQKIYDWIYLVRKEIKDQLEAVNLNVDPAYHGSPVALMQLPAWCRSSVTWFVDEGAGHDWDRYRLEMRALPDDPNISEYGEIVDFRADTLTELKGDLESYRTKFLRVDYDY